MANGACDVAEVCSGTSGTCPADGFAAAGTSCRPATGACDVAAVCTGASSSCPANGFAPAGTPCRPATGDCDLAEACTGGSANCPPDESQPNGTGCNDGLNCTTADACQNGACRGTAVTCGGGDQCHLASACVEATGSCELIAKANGSACDDGNPATQGESCQLGSCRAPSSFPSVTHLAVDDIGDLGGHFSDANAINDQGEVVGDSNTASGASHAFEWRDPGPMFDLGGVTGFGTSSSANALNDLGDFAGSMNFGDGIEHAFLDTLASGLQDLGQGGDTTPTTDDVFPYRGTYANGMNIADQVLRQPSALPGAPRLPQHAVGPRGHRLAGAQRAHVRVRHQRRWHGRRIFMGAGHAGREHRAPARSCRDVPRRRDRPRRPQQLRRSVLKLDPARRHRASRRTPTTSAATASATVCCTRFA